MRTCLICGHTANSLEHFIPQWLTKATGRESDDIEIGSAINGQLVDRQKRGTALNAKHRNLCEGCNNHLGERLEAPVGISLCPFVQPVPTDDWTERLNTMSPPERSLLAWWAFLRAVQLNEQFKNPRINTEHRQMIIDRLRRVRDGDIPALPSGVYLEIARARESVWGFGLGKHVYDRHRGTTVSHPRSLLWTMQANHCLLVLVSAPEARLLRDAGWGYPLMLPNQTTCPIYQNMAKMLECSHIDTTIWMPN